MFGKVLTVFIVSLLSLGSANPTTRVVGGRDATAGQFPYQISLRQRNSHICGGSIISKDYVLTAAHCVVESGLTPYPASEYSIRAGSINRIAGGVLHEVEEVKVHQGYKNFINDLALLKLKKPLEYTDEIKPIQLMTEAVPVGRDVVISGWGLLVTNGNTLPIILQWNDLEVISKQKCVTQTGIYNDALLCLGHEKNNGACNGDSGGPAAFEGKLAGVAGFVVTGCGSSRADGYAKVSENIDWIHANMS